MARLLIQTGGLENRPLHLRLGSNFVGRSPDCDFQIEHSSISSRHCEFILSNEGVLLRDCNSTNGTFINGEPIKEAQLQPGQTVHLGSVELLVESTEITISIPKFQQPKNFPQVGVGSPIVLPKGAMICPRHPRMIATYKCAQCSEVMCGKCVKGIKRHGGQPLFLCVVCSGKCERIYFGPQKKKSFMQVVRDTVKLPFAALSKQPPSQKSRD